MRNINREMVEEKGYKKAQLLYVLYVLENFTDEYNHLTQVEIANKVKELRGELDEDDAGKRTETKSIAKCLRILKDVGYDVRGINVTSEDDNKIHQTTRGHIWLKREIDNAKLQMIIDTVLFASYLDKAEAKELIDALIALGGPSLKDAKSASARVDGGKVYHPEKSNFFIELQRINESMELEPAKKITFKYARYKYVGDKIVLEKSREHVVSPYHYVVRNGRYYLVAFNHKQNELWHYRLDYIKDVEILRSEDALLRNETELKGQTIGEYVQQHPYMFAGKPIGMEVRVDSDRIGIVYDTFGGNNEGRGPRLLTEEGDKVVFKVNCTEEEALIWALQYGSHVEVLAPQDLRDKIRSRVEVMMFNYQSGEGDKYTEAIRFARKHKVLYLEGIDLTGKTKHETLKNIKEIRLSNNNITNIDFIKNMPSLTSVSIKNNPVTDVSVLQHCKQIRKLQLENLKIDNIDAIADLPITEIYLGLGKTEDLSALRKLNKLSRAVTTYDCVYGNEEFSYIWEDLEKQGVHTHIIENMYSDVNTNDGAYLNAQYPYNLLKRIFGREKVWVGEHDDMVKTADKFIDKFSGNEKKVLELVYKQRVSNMEAKKALGISIEEYENLFVSLDKKFENQQYIHSLEKYVEDEDPSKNYGFNDLKKRKEEIEKNQKN